MSEQRAEQLARRFHEAYERLAPSFGYETRTETRDFDPTSPNGRLMIAVCGEVLSVSPSAVGRGEEEHGSSGAESARTGPLHPVLTETQHSAGWRCFQCDKLFTNRREAEAHFGRWAHHSPACVTDSSFEALKSAYNALEADFWRLKLESERRERAADVTDPLARCSRCGERAVEHDFREGAHWCAGTDKPFVSQEMKRGCCMSDMSQPHAVGCKSAPPAENSASSPSEASASAFAQDEPLPSQPPPIARSLSQDGGES